MQWIYLICFILLSAGLLALFGVKPGDFIDALFRSQRKSATLSDELNVLLGTPAKGFFNQDYELKQILKGTGRADRYEAIKRLSLILFAVGAVLALLIGNVYMVPILGIGFSLIPIWYLRSTAASYKKHLNEELETAISIITTSYLRTEDLIRSVKENLPYINEPVKANFEAFVYEAELINANITSAINSLKMKIPNRVFHEWCGTLIQCQSDRSMKNTLPTINQKFSDVRVVQSELEAMMQGPRREAITMIFLVIANVPMLYFLNEDWFHTLIFTTPGKIALAICAAIILFALTQIMKLSKIRSIKQFGIALVDKFGVIGNQTVLRLTENLIQHRYRDDLGLDDLTENISGSYAGKLIWVAYQHDSGICLHALKEFLGKPHIHHGKLIHND